MAQRKKKEATEKTREVFIVDDKDKKEKKTITTVVETPEPISKPGEEAHYNTLLKKIFIVIGIVLVVTLFSFYVYWNTIHFEYQGITFDQIKNGDLTFYQHKIPVTYQGSPNVFIMSIRNDPRSLTKIPFNGSLNLRPIAVINGQQNFSCNGDGTIAIANIAVNLFGLHKIKTITDPNATCDTSGKYTLLEITSGNDSRIDQFGKSCYRLTVKDCEILPTTERFIVEDLIKIRQDGTIFRID